MELDKGVKVNRYSLINEYMNICLQFKSRSFFDL